MATMEDAKIFEYCENLFDKLKERDGGYYPSKHDSYAIEETAKHFSISIDEVNRIFHEFTKQTAEIEMTKINKLPPALRKKVIMERGANILRENKDLPFCEKEGPPTIPFQSHASIFYQEYEPIAINVAKLGWTIPLNIDIKHLYDLKQIPLEENEIDNFFVDYYNGKELKLICRKISKAIQTYNVGQKEIFYECLEAYNAKLYSTCLTTLITILEGFISSFGDDPLDVRMKRICKYHEQEEYKNNKIVKSLCWKSICEYIDVLFEKSKFDEDEPLTINRHWIEHGRTTRAGTQKDCIKMFNALSTMTLIEQNQ